MVQLYEAMTFAGISSGNSLPPALDSGRFASPGLLWGTVPLVLLWSCRMWLSTTRSYMHHDPILYAARDWVTWAIIGAMVLVVLVARGGLPLF